MSADRLPIYPLRFKEILRDYRFGDRWIVRQFAKTGLPDPPHPVGETWEVCERSAISARRTGQAESSEIINGPLRGRTLRQAIDTFGPELLGRQITARFGGRFPLLIKLLDATHTLGEQAHTNDELTAERGIDDYSGKTEAWYMLATEPGAKVFCGGRPGVTAERLVQAVLAGEARTCMGEYPASPGDAFLLYAGTMHYSPGGLLFYEIMQNSDVYVHLGPPREGPPEQRERQAREAVEAVHLEEGFDARPRPVTLAIGPNRRTFCLACQHFCLERLDLSAAYEEAMDGRRFIVLTVIKGAARVTCGGALRERDARGTRGQDARDTEELHSGQSCLVPAAAGAVRIEPLGGAASVLKGYVPDLLLDIIEPLRAAGVRDEEIAALGGRTRLNPLPGAMHP